jgi:hypothetical protein
VLQGKPTPRGNQIPEKGQLGKEDLFGIMTEQIDKILELVESVHICKPNVVI